MIDISGRLRIEEHNGKQIVFVDYKGLRESGMIELITKHLELTIETKLPFLADFHNTFATPGYMSHAHIFIQSTKHIVDRGAFLGIDPVKSWIFKGLLIMYPVNYKSFKEFDKAIEFLTQETNFNKD